MKKGIITVGIILIAIAGIAFVLDNNKAKNEAQTAIVARENDGVSVRIAEAVNKDMNSQYATNGIFAPKQEVVISTETAGKIAKVLVDEGAHVRAGQTLAVIDGDKQNVAVTNARAVFNDAENELARYKSAYATGGVTKQQLDQIQLQLENAKNNLRSAQLNATDANIKASFPGVVNKRNIETGSYVNPGQELFEIVNISSLKLKVNVDEKTIGSIHLGQKVSVTSSVLPDEQWSGTVTFIAPKADAGLNFPVELEIKNNGSNGLKAGMYGTAIFGADKTINALVIPRTAFVGNVSSNKVFVASNGIAELKEVVSGRKFGDYVEILSGLSEGEKVITSGQINLLDQSPIQIIK